MFPICDNVGLNYGKVKSYPERVLNIKPFINKYKWKGINYPSKIDDFKRFEKINPWKMCSAYISKINLNWIVKNK